jgi:E3 ubiquitin-protein ligase UHRF1
MLRPSASAGSIDSHHYIQNIDKPDRAYTTKRANRVGKANASSGKILVTTASDYFGPILLEQNPIRKLV